MAALGLTTLLFAIMAWVQTPLQLGILRFLLGFADGALMPAVQTLLLKYSSDQVTGRIFGYNQSFMYLGNVVGPLIGSSISALMGFRWVFAVTAVLVLINCLLLRSQFRKVESVRK
ncbi:drug efflux system protein MdtG [compost metagenome]